MTLRFMTWNIKTGGKGRLDAIATVIRRERPDLLALQELRGFDRDDGRVMRELAGATGMTAHLARSFLGQPVAVLVREPLEIVERAAVRWRLHHAAAIVTVATPAGRLRVVSTHLNPFSPPRRRREAVWLAHRYNPAKMPTIVAGDLNGLDPGTDHTETLRPQPGFLQARHLAADGTADTRAVAAFVDAGFTDLWKVAGSGSPLTVPTTRGGGREFSRMRLDYVMASPRIAEGAKDMVVVRGDETEFASDHYPVRVELS
ncbi:endonuclease/exonuclease/phosphatase family protein [Actinoplanes sp. LDG1-06]|uniref:Endonuclease/exonuclease/phosphatase family protein n=1 Tax=Paractinoplanes ovalisporus TaxID=2810368 RepID=A0ABS2AQF6_9ACTN|nr:endonuclease/exonuclease/phosphatase family protein [Actinoplanes ovalisporus]MBM2622093.1 endonuclease/exonuclease/phosphatase family protein [Actinoplanes ovalisporus]